MNVGDGATEEERRSRVENAPTTVNEQLTKNTKALNLQTMRPDQAAGTRTLRELMKLASYNMAKLLKSLQVEIDDYFKNIQSMILGVTKSFHYKRFTQNLRMDIRQVLGFLIEIQKALHVKRGIVVEQMKITQAENDPTLLNRLRVIDHYHEHFMTLESEVDQRFDTLLAHEVKKTYKPFHQTLTELDSALKRFFEQETMILDLAEDPNAEVEEEKSTEAEK